MRAIPVFDCDILIFLLRICGALRHIVVCITISKLDCVLIFGWECDYPVYGIDVDTLDLTLDDVEIHIRDAPMEILLQEWKHLIVI
jgi:hypothetical protein